ncbi:SH2 domain-containing protein 4B-like [Ptychodera flava]|uniref:SH2 domain-containing protein 4B-like n=1 Tax=Ptychodera flava TaxID=63121 RepID=UPI00396A01CB
MLQQILRDMYIEPELLAELSEDQKQVLFVKMREEQVRRWQESEEKTEKENSRNFNRPQKKVKKRVQIALGTDGEPWTWVMGDHKDDKSYDQLIDEVQLERARKLAAAEEAEQRAKEEQERLRRQREAEQRLERERTKLDEERRKKDEEQALFASLKQAKLEAEKLEKQRLEKESQMREIAAKEKKLKEERERQEQEIRRREKERARELYQKWKRQAALNSQAEESETKQQDEIWKVQLRRSKKADKERSEAAKRARVSLRMSGDYSGLSFADVALQVHNRNLAQKGKPGIPPKPQNQSRGRPARPKCRGDVIQWIKEVEAPKGVGIDPTTNKVAEWFHGIIPRQEAEELLKNKHVGTFLVRVSERVWGYTISFMDADRIKHFLIDTSDNTYQFFGANQLAHNSLYELVTYYKNTPISEVGQEYLRTPCGQVKDPPDYADILDPNEVHSTNF